MLGCLVACGASEEDCHNLAARLVEYEQKFGTEVILNIDPSKPVLTKWDYPGHFRACQGASLTKSQVDCILANELRPDVPPWVGCLHRSGGAADLFR